jgi:hypothetical protein
LTAWIQGRRAMDDLDLPALASLAEADEAVRAVAPSESSDGFEVVSSETIRAETPSPGRRYHVGPERLRSTLAQATPWSLRHTEWRFRG